MEINQKVMRFQHCINTSKPQIETRHLRINLSSNGGESVDGFSIFEIIAFGLFVSLLPLKTIPLSHPNAITHERFN